MVEKGAGHESGHHICDSIVFKVLDSKTVAPWKVWEAKDSTTNIELNFFASTHEGFDSTNQAMEYRSETFPGVTSITKDSVVGHNEILNMKSYTMQ